MSTLQTGVHQAGQEVETLRALPVTASLALEM